MQVLETLDELRKWSGERARHYRGKMSHRTVNADLRAAEHLVRMQLALLEAEAQYHLANKIAKEEIHGGAI